MAIFKSSSNDPEMAKGLAGQDIGGSDLPLGVQRGHCCYAFKQEDMWLGFADLAQDLISKARTGQSS
jgi:hypothetical protein